MPTPQRFISLNDVFTAHVLEAKLASEGIDGQLRGAVHGGPCALTVREAARVDLFVPEDQLEDARLVLLASAVDEVLAAPSEWAGPIRSVWSRWITLVVLLAAALAPVATYLRLRRG